MLSLKNKALLKIVSRGYRFNKKGDLLNPKGKHLVYRFTNGYPAIKTTFKNNGKRKYVLVTLHRIRAYFKYGEEIFKPGVEVRHLNGDKLDWSEENIAIGSSSDNKQDIDPKIRLKYSKNAAKNIRRLSDKQANDLRKERAEGKTYKELCEKYGISKSSVSYIINNRYYRQGA